MKTNKKNHGVHDLLLIGPNNFGPILLGI